MHTSNLSLWDCDLSFLLLRLASGWGGEAELDANLMRLPHLTLRLYLGRCMMSWCPGLSVSYTDRLSIHQTQMSVSQDPACHPSVSPLNCPRFLSPKDSRCPCLRLVETRYSLTFPTWDLTFSRTWNDGYLRMFPRELAGCFPSKWVLLRKLSQWVWDTCGAFLSELEVVPSLAQSQSQDLNELDKSCILKYSHSHLFSIFTCSCSLMPNFFTPILFNILTDVTFVI